jgi:D-serine deaminase-like pyridoxal phosphate-dependent protein
MDLSDLDTPVVVVDLDRMEANIAALQNYLSEHGIANRPHIKTHKSPFIAHKQLAAGASGITCQKLGEAEVMAQAGCSDIFLPYNLIGKQKLDRLAALARYTTISVTADSPEVIAGLADRFAGEPAPLSVLVECDTGGQRCGVQSPQEAAVLARQIATAPGLRFGGLMTYPCNDATDPFMAETKALLAADGIPVERVSGGGCPRMWQAHTWREVTEYRVGTFVYGDRKCVQVGVMRYDQCALAVIATVVSRPTADRGIVDTGSKSLTSDTNGLVGHGYIVEYPEATIYGLSEEHGHVDFSACATRPAIGERVSIIPNHCCTVSNLFDEVIGVRGQQVELRLPIAARGLLR